MSTKHVWFLNKTTTTKKQHSQYGKYLHLGERLKLPAKSMALADCWAGNLRVPCQQTHCESGDGFFHLVKTPGTKKPKISISNKFPLKPTRETNKYLFKQMEGLGEFE